VRGVFVQMLGFLCELELIVQSRWGLTLTWLFQPSLSRRWNA